MFIVKCLNIKTDSTVPSSKKGSPALHLPYFDFNKLTKPLVKSLK